jgi:hypothetical protein
MGLGHLGSPRGLPELALAPAGVSPVTTEGVLAGFPL